MPYCLVNDYNLYYELAGDMARRPVIFLSGLTGDHQNWQLQVQSLRDSYNCLTFDWRDTGKSSVGVKTQYSLYEMAQDVVGLLYQLQLAPFHKVNIVGLSMGGAVAQEAVLSFPELFNTVILASSFSVPRPGLELPANRQTTGNLRHLAALRPHDTRHRLTELNIPALVVAGARDATTPLAGQQELAESMPDAQFSVIEGAGHLVNLEKAGEFNRIIRRFLDNYNFSS